MTDPIRPGGYVVLRSQPRHVIFVTDVGPRTRGERTVGGAKMFYGLSGTYLPYPNAERVPAVDEDVEAYRHATDEEITDALERGVLAEPERN